MKKNKALDIRAIRKSIKEKHNALIENVGEIPLMLDSDDSVNLIRVDTKLKAIMQCFLDEKIIDEYEESSNSPMYISHTMIKNGYSSRVVVATDGNRILFKTIDFPIELGWLQPFFKVVEVENVDTFDWEDFSLNLLSFVHEIIYRRKASVSVKLFGMDSNKQEKVEETKHCAQ